MQVLPEPGDDEERVVDSDADPDHRHENRCDRVDAREPGEDEEQDERGRDGEECESDRDRGRDERPEDDQQHDERGEEAEELLCPLLDRRELGVAVELDDDAGRLDRLAHGVLHGDDPRPVRRLDDVGELRLRVGNAPVVGERALAERVADAFDADLVAARRELRGLELRDGVLDGGLALGRVETFSLGCCKDQIEDGALLGGELRLDQVGRTLRVRARDLELVLQAPADGRNEQDERGDDPHPPEDHFPRVVGAPAHPARERTRREALVGGQTVGIGPVYGRLDVTSPISFVPVFGHAFRPPSLRSPIGDRAVAGNSSVTWRRSCVYARPSSISAGSSRSSTTGSSSTRVRASKYTYAVTSPTNGSAAA